MWRSADAVEQGSDGAALPPRNIDTDAGFVVVEEAIAEKSQTVDRLFEGDLLALVGADVAGVVEIDRGKQLFEARPRATARDWLPIIGQSPTGVEGRTKTAHGSARHDGFKAHLAGDHVDPIDRLHQLPRIDRRGDMADALAAGSSQVSALAAANHLWVRLDPNFSFGVFALRRPQHRLEGGALGKAVGDRGIVVGLIDHQYARPTRPLLIDTR